MKSGKNRVRLTASNVPVVIGETEITPGDIACGDDSGVVVVPAALAPKVLEVASEIEAMEQRVLSDVSGGMPLRQARELHAYNQYSFRASR
jgi:regulator of RNase E activity RraA